MLKSICMYEEWTLSNINYKIDLMMKEVSHLSLIPFIFASGNLILQLYLLCGRQNIIQVNFHCIQIEAKKKHYFIKISLLQFNEIMPACCSYKINNFENKGAVWWIDIFKFTLKRNIIDTFFSYPPTPQWIVNRNRRILSIVVVYESTSHISIIFSIADFRDVIINSPGITSY